MAKEYNFIDPKTNEKFTIAVFKSKYDKDLKDIVYFDEFWQPLTNPNNGNRLEKLKLKGTIQAPAIFTDTASRYAKNAAYIKDRAKKHANSDEEKYKKKKRMNEELSSYTGKKLKK